MSLWAGIKNLFQNLGPTKSSDHDDETHVDGASKRKSTLGLFFLRLAKSFPLRHSEANKDPIQKASNIDGHGETHPQPSQRPTDSVTSHIGPLLSSQRPRAPSTISTISHESIQDIVPQGLKDGIASASTSTTPSSLDSGFSDKSLDDPVAEKHRLLAELESATTRKRRRHIIHKRLSIDAAVKWMLKHPEDLWDTDEEEEAKFAHMVADDAVEEAEWQDAHGLDVLREHPPKEYKTMRKRAKVVGWYSALQETVFREEWLAEGGMFGQKGSGGPPPEEVGPMGEML